MSTEERYLLLVTVDIDPEKEEAWNDWYNNVHVPAILECPGFLSARRYRAVEGNGPRYVAAYEIADEHVLETEGFNRAKGWAEFSQFVIDPKRTIYREILARRA